MILRAYIVHSGNEELLNRYDFGKTWAYWLKKNNYSLREVTTSKISRIEDITVKNEFVKRIALIVAEHKLHPSLVVNMDETGLNFLPVLRKTYEKKGASGVSLNFTDEKRKSQSLLAVALMVICYLHRSYLKEKRLV